MSLPISQNPELETVALEIVGTGKSLSTWKSYRFNSHLLTPTDGFSFTVGVEDITEELRRVLQPGAEVRLSVNDATQASGYIDSVEITQDPNGGTEIQIEGRDKIAYAVDGHIDPKVQFKTNTTIEQFAKQVFEPYGFSIITDDPVANLNVQTRATKGIRLTKKGKFNKSDTVHELRPYPQEGAFAFASRVIERAGGFIWPSADGQSIVLSGPNFDQPVIYKLRRKLGQAASSGNNILQGGAKRDLTDQPTVIFGYGGMGGGDFAHSQLKAAIVNPLLISSDTDALLAKYPGITQVTLDGVDTSNAVSVARGRAMYLRDPDANTKEQLESFLRREMSLRTRHALVCRYVVPGHIQYGLDDAIWNVDTMVDVQDDVCRVNEPMYVISRTFSKSVHGTFTELELIRPYTLALK